MPRVISSRNVPYYFQISDSYTKEDELGIYSIEAPDASY